MRTMILAPLVLALLAASVAPKPRISSLDLSVTRAATTVTVKGCWTATGGPDGFVTTGTASGQPTQTHPPLGVVNCDSYTFNAPAPATTVSGNFQVIAVRRGKQSSPTTRAWSYTEADVPPPPVVVDSIRVTPASTTVAPGASIQFIATVWSH